MKKKVLFLIFILIIDTGGFYYVYQNYHKKKAFKIDEINEAIIINIKELEFESFEFEDYFYLKNIQDYKYELNDYLEITYIDLYDQKRTISYPYIKIEPPKIEPIKAPNPSPKPVTNQSPEPIQKPSNEPYFKGYHDIKVQLDSSIDHLVHLLMKDIQSNQNVSINYASVNLSSGGSYPVYYYVGDQTYTINVKVE